MSSFPWFKMTFWSAGIIGMGYVIMRTTTPTEEQVYNAMSPDLRRQVDTIRAARIAREQATQQQTNAQVRGPLYPDAQKPVWADGQRR
ncbi:hypothetical protein PHLGIDRAFT_75386 [Phlebiopsis gigantea 11061_1 CR5-6]|uniref:Uncharacterized protein n=1 Tax=Phlebiopsis gigantea (strain 11061_1 CR5-6) TaxID=745531 RepID=A0A0C3NIP7_PHLG1|nr:hypothetical protein PHLGIDRAFT_75386 [Phlebiopsis gigantea 11061_1 CR5-6]